MTKFSISNSSVFLFLLIFTSVSFNVKASGSETWKNFSDAGAYGLVATAFLIPELKDDREGLKQAFYSVIAASGIGLVGKNIIDAKRPDNNGNDSFPSNHTANSFAAATTLQRRYGWKYGVPAYGVAALVGTGRVKARRHHWRDVFAGALLGTSTAWYFTNRFNDKTEVQSWVGNKAAGVSYSVKW